MGNANAPGGHVRCQRRAWRPRKLGLPNRQNERNRHLSAGNAEWAGAEDEQSSVKARRARHQLSACGIGTFARTVADGPHYRRAIGRLNTLITDEAEEVRRESLSVF